MLLTGAGAGVRAQSSTPEANARPNQRTVTLGAVGETGSIAGRLTDLHSAPLAGATVVVRNAVTGAETRTVTAKNGSYRFGGLDAGEYTLDAESPQLGHGRLEGIYVSGGHEARVQAAMDFEPAGAQPVEVAAHEPAPPAAPVSRSAAPWGGTPAVVQSRPAKGVPGLPVSSPNPPLTGLENTPQALTPLQELAQVRRRAEEQAREKPATVAELMAWTLALETPPGLALGGRALPVPTPPKPATAATVLVAALAAEPLLTLSLSGRAGTGTANLAAAAGASVTVPPAGDGLAVSAAAASAMGAALQGVQFAPGGVQPAAWQPDPATAAVTTAVSGVEIQALPAAGRRWQDFVLDTPTASTAAGGTAQTSLRGAGQEPVETTIDGVSTRVAFGGQGSSGAESQGPGSNGGGGSGQSGMGQAWAGGHGAPVAEAAIREVQTAAGNAEAEGSRTAGGQLNVDTARGTNGLHGQGFLFDRENAWGAQNPFTQWVKQTTPATLTAPPVFTAVPYTPSDRETVWGVGVGSQIKRRKLFWFGALDSYQRNDPGLATVKNPAEFFAQPSNDQLLVLCARLGLTVPGPPGEPSSCPMDTVVGKYSQMLTTLDGLLGPAPRRAAQWVGFGRVDWQASERHRFTLEEIGAHWNSPGGGLTRVSEAYGSNSFGSSVASEELVLARWEAFVTPNLLAVFQGSAGRTTLAAHAETPSAYEQTFLSVNAWGQLPQIAVDSRYGFTIGNPSRFGTGNYPEEQVTQGREMVDWVRGNLLVKSGFELSHNADATSLLRNQTGSYHYASVENFASDALVFAQYGIAALDPGITGNSWHNCDQTGKAWRDSTGQLEGGGYLPCYSYYSQTIGPNNWNLSTNDWAGFSTVQWQPAKLLAVSGGLRWELEQMPPPLAALANTDLPQAGKAPNSGSNWGPRLSLALGSLEKHWPVLRLGYGMYFGRTENATLETALTQTGSPNGDQFLFLRPTDNLNAGGAPPFPYVLKGAPGSVVKPGAVEFAASFRNPEIDQAVAAVEEELPGHVVVTAAGMMSLGRRLPVSIDTNIDTQPADAGTITYDVVNCPATFHGSVVTCTGTGPIKSPKITVPFYASWPSATSPTGYTGRLNPNYQQIAQIMSRANSTYEAAMLKVVRYGRRGLSLHAHYTYAHAGDWNPNESLAVAGSDVLDPADFNLERGTSNLDVRHSAAVMAVMEAPWKLPGRVGWLANGWLVSGIGQFRSGLPYTMHVTGSLPECIVTTGETSCATQYAGLNAIAGDAIVGLAPGMNGSGGDSRVYGLGSDNKAYNMGRNTFRYPATWKADLRVGKKFDLGKMREVELLAESFNLFNHQNVTEMETAGYYLSSGTASSPPSLNFLNSFTLEPPIPGLAPRSAFGQPLNINATNFYRERQVQLGLRVRF
ncbi:MAG: carboxypeptidase-like regulatory domain-containing protein [Terracidiphilus sp.]|nr:carboxypeptidase-like regulatory domain-containing protein [Terracidiphilus sp.]